jgi:hypothetical protein
MRKYLLIFLLLPFANCFAQDTTATIVFFFDKYTSSVGLAKIFSYDIMINGHKVGRVGKDDLVKFEMFSKGNMLIEIGIEEAVSNQLTVKVEPGKTYYVSVDSRIGMVYSLEAHKIEEADAKKIIAKKKDLSEVILEEDKEDPVSKKLKKE